MVHRYNRDQWSIYHLDWSKPARDLCKEDETAIIQYFTDMAGIERLASALFLSQQQRAANQELKDILATSVIDERRHSRIAELLANHYNANN